MFLTCVIYQQSHVGVRSMEEVGVPSIHSLDGTSHTTPYERDSWYVLFGFDPIHCGALLSLGEVIGNLRTARILQ